MALRVLLVGTGITSAITASLLRKKCQDQIQVVVWDKARGTGGRMSTSRSPSEDSCIADLGAQYITCKSGDRNKLGHSDIYTTLLSADLLQPLTATVEGLRQFPDDTHHFVAPLGMGSLVKHLFGNVKDSMHFNRQVLSINKLANRWEVATQTGITEQFDVVILTMPVPQILQLTGTVREIIVGTQEIHENLSQTEFSSRYALGLFYDKNVALDLPWDVKYLVGDSAIRYVSVDNRKRNQAEKPTAVVVHTSIEFGKSNVDKSLEEVKPVLIEEVKKLFPELPEAASVKCHKWRFSQVVVPYPGAPGFLILENDPLLLAGGDGFSTSNFDGCIASALKLSEQVEKLIAVGIDECRSHKTQPRL